MRIITFLLTKTELITKLFDINSIVTLRIYLRELINLDSSNLKGQASVDHKSISEISLFIAVDNATASLGGISNPL